MIATLIVDAFLHGGRELAHRHLEAAVADDRPDFGFGPRALGADRRRDGEAHRAEAARGDERPRRFVVVVLRFPHLVLADVGDDDRVAVARRAPEVVDDVRRIQVPVVGQRLDVADRRVALDAVDVRQPRAAIARRDRAASAASSTSRRSPMSATSTGTFLLISDGSISMWIFFAFGA